MPPSTTFFAPQLYIKHGVTDISFYEKALGAVKIMRFSNDDESQLWQSSKRLTVILHFAQNFAKVYQHSKTIRSFFFL